MYRNQQILAGTAISRIFQKINWLKFGGVFGQISGNLAVKST